MVWDTMHFNKFKIVVDHLYCSCAIYSLLVVDQNMIATGDEDGMLKVSGASLYSVEG